MSTKTAPTSLLPFDLGVTLPSSERYTDSRFRRVCGNVYFHALDGRTAVELVAFFQLVNPQACAKIFGWNAITLRTSWKLFQSEAHLRAAQPLIEANARALSVEAGMRVLEALKIGGWKAAYGSPTPWIVKQTLLQLRADGMKGVDVAKLAGISPHTVSTWRRTPKSGAAAAQAAASLAVG